MRISYLAPVPADRIGSMVFVPFDSNLRAGADVDLALLRRADEQHERYQEYCAWMQDTGILCLTTINTMSGSNVYYVPLSLGSCSIEAFRKLERYLPSVIPLRESADKRYAKVWVCGGIGDVIDVLPSVEELARQGYILYPDPASGPLANVLRLSPYIQNGDPPANAPRFSFPVMEKSGDSLEDLQTQTRVLKAAERYGLSLRWTNPKIMLQPDLIAKMTVILGKPRKARIGLALNANVEKQRTLAPERQRMLVEALVAEGYSVYLFHHVETLGDSLHVVDLGKRLSLIEAIHAAALMHAFVCTDTGWGHLSAALCVPTVYLTCSHSTGQVFGAFQHRKIELSSACPKRPCFMRHGWQNHYGCSDYPVGLSKIPIERIVGAVRFLLEPLKKFEKSS